MTTEQREECLRLERIIDVTARNLQLEQARKSPLPKASRALLSALVKLEQDYRCIKGECYVPQILQKSNNP